MYDCNLFLPFVRVRKEGFVGFVSQTVVENCLKNSDVNLQANIS